MITYIHGVTVYVSDQDRSLTFYRDVLGFEVTKDMEGPGMRWITVAPKGAQTNLILFRALPEMADKVGIWTGMVLHTGDIEKTHQELVSRGVRFTQEPRKMDWGGIEGQFADPDGNTFELVQSPKW